MSMLITFGASFVQQIWLTLLDLLPIICIIVGFQLLVIRKPLKHPKQLLKGFIAVVVGLTLFLIGLEQALFPIGRVMAQQLTAVEFIAADLTDASQLQWTDYYWVYLFAFLMGFSTTIAEPALIAVAIKAHQVSAGSVSVWGLRIAVALGVAVGIALGSYRIVTGIPLQYFMIAGYVLVLVQTYFSPKLIIALAYDSGGVTTSTVTVPIVAALGLGLSEQVPGSNPLIDGFGLIAFASLFPIISVLAYAQIAHLINTKQQPWRS